MAGHESVIQKYLQKQAGPGGWASERGRGSSDVSAKEAAEKGAAGLRAQKNGAGDEEGVRASLENGGGKRGGSENCSLFVMPSHTRGVGPWVLSSQPASTCLRVGAATAASRKIQRRGQMQIQSQARRARLAPRVLLRRRICNSCWAAPTIGSLTCIENSGTCSQATTACDGSAPETWARVRPMLALCPATQQAAEPRHTRARDAAAGHCRRRGGDPLEAVCGSVVLLPFKPPPGLVGEHAVGDVGADVRSALRGQQPLALNQRAACGGRGEGHGGLRTGAGCCRACRAHGTLTEPFVMRVGAGTSGWWVAQSRVCCSQLYEGLARRSVPAAAPRAAQQAAQPRSLARAPPHPTARGRPQSRRAAPAACPP